MDDPQKVLEFDGESLEDALANASASLDIPQAELHYEVVEEGRRGFLGVGGREVRIRILSGTESSQEEPADGSVEPDEAQGPAEPSPGGEAGQIHDFLNRFLPKTPFEIAFKVTEDEERVVVDLEGNDQGLLLERRGEALHALQTLLGRVASQKGLEKTIFVDSGNFRQNRDNELAEIALRVAERVKKVGEPQSLSPMNPYERRLVHLALQEDPEVETRSDGEGFLKKVTIHPLSDSAPE